MHLYAPKRRGTGKFSVSGERVEERGEEVKREQGESDWRRRRNAMMIQVERVKVCCCIRFSHSRELERKEDVSRVTIFAKRKRTCYLVEFISI